MNQARLPFFMITLFICSCVPSKKLTLLRAEEKGKDVAKDEVVSRYQVEDFQYTLRPNDVISIKVASATPSEFDILNYQSDKSLSGITINDPLLTGFNIEEDGTIFLPVIGKVEIAGLTLSEAREKLQNIVSDYLESPTVDLKLLSFQFTILGEVENEGVYTTYTPKFSLLDALGRAGGLSDFADGAQVKIVRYNNEALEVAYVDVLEEELLSSPYYYVRPNDLITVPPLKAKNFRDNSSQNLALLFSAITAVGIFLNWIY